MWSDDTRVSVYSKYTTAEGVATERERESTLTLSHSCHRPCIPFGHVLIERTCVKKHCKRGCNKEKAVTNPPQTTKKSTVSTTQTQKEQNVWELWSDYTRVVDIQNTQQRKASRRGHREGERVHLLPSIFVTAPVFHFDTSRLNTDAPQNTAREWKKGATKKTKTNPPQTTNKVPFNTQKQNNNTCENCDPIIKLESAYIQKTQQRRGDREGESTLTAIHSCHRTRIPFGHVLIERRCEHKHCKRGCNKERKINPPQNTTKGTVSQTQKQTQ